MRTRMWIIRDTVTRLWPERVLTWLVWKLPRRLVLACVVRGAVEASPRTGIVQPDRICYPQMHDALAQR